MSCSCLHLYRNTENTGRKRHSFIQYVEPLSQVREEGRETPCIRVEHKPFSPPRQTHPEETCSGDVSEWCRIVVVGGGVSLATAHSKEAADNRKLCLTRECRARCRKRKGVRMDLQRRGNVNCGWCWCCD